MTRSTFRLLATLTLVACSRGGDAELGSESGSAPETSAPGAALVLDGERSSWVGTLPCADCGGIRTTLTLGADGTYRRSDAYLGTQADAGEDTLFTAVGRWFRDGPDGAEAASVSLISETDGPQRLQALADGGLRALDRDGQPIASEVPHRLEPAVDPVHGGRFQAVGAFSYFADAALFVTCESGLQLPVAMEGGYLDLERVYVASGVSGPSPMLVRVTGRLEARPAVDREGTETVVVVEDHAALDGPCRALELPGALSDPWRLTRLDGQPIDAGLPTITLSRDAEGQLSGSAGCNRFTGRGTLRGSLLVPGPLAVTRRFCEGVMALEGRVLDVLGAGGWLRLEDDALILRQGPDAVARFEPADADGAR